jgi:hypothetical protein
MIGELRRSRKVNTPGMKEPEEFSRREISAYQLIVIRLFWWCPQLGKHKVVDRLKIFFGCVVALDQGELRSHMPLESGCVDMRVSRVWNVVIVFKHMTASGTAFHPRISTA